MTSGNIRSLALLGLLVILPPSSAGAQIVNALRGFQEQELSWSGGVEGTIAAAEGNTDYFEYELSAAAQHGGTR